MARRSEAEAAVLHEVARGCVHKFRATAEQQVVRDLFARAGAGKALATAGHMAGALERFRRRRQRRAARASGRPGEGSPCAPGSGALVCPITMTHPEEPVLLTDGHVYERRAIDAWLAKSSTSPLTREPIGLKPYVQWNKAVSAVGRHAAPN